jgi:hypothetical protein
MCICQINDICQRLFSCGTPGMHSSSSPSLGMPGNYATYFFQGNVSILICQPHLWVATVQAHEQGFWWHLLWNKYSLAFCTAWTRICTHSKYFFHKNKVKLSQYMPWRRVGKWITAPLILNLCTRWRWVVSFTPRTFYLWGKNLRYPLSRRQGGPQRRSGLFGEEKNLLSLLGIEARCLGCQARGLVAVLSYHCPWSTCVTQITGVCWEYLYCNTEQSDRDKPCVVVTSLPPLSHKMEHCHVHFRSLFGAPSCDKHPSGTHKVHCSIACILSPIYQ